MKLPPAKLHVKGKYDVAVFIREATGGTLEFTSTVPLDRDHPIVRHACEALAAALKIDAEDIR